MVQSNEFKGATLADAVRNATAAYDRKTHYQEKSYCRDLRSDYDAKKQEMDRIWDRIVDLQREVDGLKRQAAAAQLTALVSAAAVAARALANAKRIAGFLRRLRLDGRTLNGLQRNAPDGATALLSAATALAGQSALSEVRELEQEITRLKARYDQIVDDMMGFAESFARANCHLGSGVV